VTDYDYDIMGNVTRVAHPDGSVVTYTYDKAGNRTGVSTAEGTSLYAYDALHRLSSVTDPHGHVTRYAYDAVGNVTRIEYPNGLITKRTYDSMSRITSTETVNGAASVLFRETYEYSQGGNRTKVISHDGSSVSFQYDALSRLDIETWHTSEGAAFRKLDYDYDAWGNRVKVTDLLTNAVTDYAHNTLDQLVTRGAETFTYDANGNLRTRTAAEGTRTFGFDAQQRLSQVALPDGRKVQYTLDGQGRRIGATTDTRRNFVLDVATPFSRVLAEKGEGDAPVATYTYGHELLSAKRTGGEVFYIYDAFGSVRALADETGTITDSYAYDGFGQVVVRTGTTSNDFYYRGEQLDPVTGLYHLRARDYDPSLGRFVSVDSAQGTVVDPRTLNRYTYALNDPVNRIDPSGHVSKKAGNDAHRDIGAYYVRLHGEYPHNGFAASDKTMPKGDHGAGRGKRGGGTGLRPDLRHYWLGDVYEIKPLTPFGLLTVHGQALAYVFGLNATEPDEVGNGNGWNLGDSSFRDPSPEEVGNRWVKGHSWFGAGAVIYHDGIDGERQLRELEMKVMYELGKSLASALSQAAERIKMPQMPRIPRPVPVPANAVAGTLARARHLLLHGPGMIMRYAVASHRMLMQRMNVALSLRMV
jgi:RHS repeat-associated protein